VHLLHRLYGVDAPAALILRSIDGALLTALY